MVYGNLVENGVIIKLFVVMVELMIYKGKVVVFEDIEDYNVWINLEDLEVDEICVLVLKNVGFKGYLGMFEVGNMGIFFKLLRVGVKDMICIFDGCMSGIVFGIVFFYVLLEFVVGGNLVFV